MPTAARMTAAIAFAIIGYIIFAAMVPIYLEYTVPRFLLPLCIGSGLWAGWVLCGKNAHSIASGIGTGYTAVIAQVFWILLIMSFVFMIDQAMRRRYDGPMARWTRSWMCSPSCMKTGCGLAVLKWA